MALENPQRELQVEMNEITRKMEVLTEECN